MSLSSFIYRLKPQSGDTTPHDETTTGADLSGGTIALVDRGSGDWVWRFSGAANAAIASRVTVPESAGGGHTFAVRMAVTTWPAGSFDPLVGYSTDTSYLNGDVFTANATNNIRARHYDSTNDTVTMLAVNTSIRTYVFKVVCSSGTDKVHVWIDTVGRSGVAANYISAGQNYNGKTLDTIVVGISGSVIEISDLVNWGEELSDADCAALADNGIRTTLDSAAATATTLSGPSSGTTGVASTNFTVGANGTITGTVTVTPGDGGDGGTFTPTSVAISSGTPTTTFTYTPASTGVKTISISDDGGLTDATSLSYTAAATGGDPAAISRTFSQSGINIFGIKR